MFEQRLPSSRKAFWCWRRKQTNSRRQAYSISSVAMACGCGCVCRVCLVLLACPLLLICSVCIPEVERGWAAVLMASWHDIVRSEPGSTVFFSLLSRQKWSSLETSQMNLSCIHPLCGEQCNFYSSITFGTPASGTSATNLGELQLGKRGSENLTLDRIWIDWIDGC